MNLPFYPTNPARDTITHSKTTSICKIAISVAHTQKILSNYLRNLHIFLTKSAARQIWKLRSLFSIFIQKEDTIGGTKHERIRSIIYCKTI